MNYKHTYITTGGAADILGLAQVSVYNLCKRGALKCIRVNDRFLLDSRDVEAYKAAGKVRGRGRPPERR